MKKYLQLPVLLLSLLLSVPIILSAEEIPPRFNLRSTYKTLSESQFHEWQKTLQAKYSHNLEGDRIVNHNYKLEIIDGDKVVVDNATGLMWHQSGSAGFGVTWQDAGKWVSSLNSGGYAGYHDWRLPTLEEAASLLRAGKDSSGLYIDAIFDNKQKYLWSGDPYNNEEWWFVDLNQGNITWSSEYIYGFNRNLRVNFVRPVRTAK